MEKKVLQFEVLELIIRLVYQEYQGTTSATWFCQIYT